MHNGLSTNSQSAVRPKACNRAKIAEMSAVARESGEMNRALHDEGDVESPFATPRVQRYYGVALAQQSPVQEV
ncbi:MAG: hypothetical protein M1820_010792 [Bogoriella megaspora]|nr:MAG: hypothetical protein M1820_010792 [Bogoriella megaspora]